jgi:hypothetical protein
MSPKLCLGLQNEYDLEIAADKLGPKLERDVKVFARIKA